MRTGIFPLSHWMRSAGLALFLVPACLADTIRVTTWNLEVPAGGPAPGAAAQGIRQAAATLRMLDPDVILVRRARDWKTCEQLVQALKPTEYTVVLCSSFHDARTGALSSEQVAILSKQRAYFSWSEAWRAEGDPKLGGGFAFAAIQFKDQRVGFFSVQLDDKLSPAAGGDEGSGALRARDSAARQWSLAVESFRNWVTNRVGAVVVAGGFDPSPGGGPQSGGRDSAPVPQAAAFVNGFLGAPLHQPVTLPAQGEPSDTSADYLRASLTANPDTLSGVILSRTGTTCDLDVNPGGATASPPARSEASRDRREEADTSATALQLRNTQRPTPIQTPADAKPEVPAASAALTSEPKAPELIPDRQPFVSAAPTGSGSSLTPVPGGNGALAQAGSAHPLRWVAQVTGLVALVVITWMLARRKGVSLPPASALLPAQAESSGSVGSSYTVIVTPGRDAGSGSDNAAAPPIPNPVMHVETAGTTQTQSKAWPLSTMRAWPPPGREATFKPPWVVLHFSQWLKQRLVQKLLLDRAQLLHTQQAATLKMMNVDERLARIELQVRQQNRAYERRIEQLNQELLAAKQENRELIRARILEVRTEMEAARVKMMAQAQGEEGQ